jgi:hypothetical protein
MNKQAILVIFYARNIRQTNEHLYQNYAKLLFSMKYGSRLTKILRSLTMKQKTINVRDIFDCVAKKKDNGFILELFSDKYKIRLHFDGLWWIKYLTQSLWSIIHSAEKEIGDIRNGMEE